MVNLIRELRTFVEMFICKLYPIYGNIFSKHILFVMCKNNTYVEIYSRNMNIYVSLNILLLLCLRDFFQALLGAQLVITLIMVSTIQKLSPHFSFARWILCSTGYVQYKHIRNH